MTESVPMEEYEKLKKSVDFIINRRKEVDEENKSKRETVKKDYREFVSKLPYYISIALIIFSIGFAAGISVAK